MNPVTLLLASLWKFVAVVGVMGVSATSIGLMVKSAVKKGVIKSRCNNVVHAVKTKKNSKTKKRYNQSERIIDKVDERSRNVSQVQARVRTSSAAPINSENYTQDGRVVTSSLTTPGLKKLADDYLSRADLKGEKQFSTVKLSYAENSNVKNEELVAPTSFVEFLFVPKAIYECAIAKDVAYPVTISYGAGKNEQGQDVERVITLDSRETAREIAIERLSQMDTRILDKAQMDISKLTQSQDLGRDQ